LKPRLWACGHEARLRGLRRKRGLMKKYNFINRG
jgi:hypothetical protein